MSADRHADLFALAKREAILAAVATFLDAEGLRPLFFKGWTVAQFYDRPDERAMGDIDICAMPREFSAVRRALETLVPPAARAATELEDGTVNLHIAAGAPHLGVMVDLHRHLAKYRLEVDEVFAQAQELRVGGQARILVPCPEHHLRICAMHFVIDGGVHRRPLEDVAAIVAACTETFDWQRALGHDPIVRGWVACAVRLAEQLLSRDRAAALPDMVRDVDPPAWLLKTVRAALNRGEQMDGQRMRLSEIYRLAPRHLPREIAARWPNPIRASVELNRAFDNAPRFPIQLAHFLRGTVRYAMRPLARRV
ncbi:nucleotidyltransferase family protein [Limibaculum sp. FT325]|uniref:nucleotidyltransferase family protein n=1 Tax=Thermohalobaculum sediminis TaxID=2939436 RepID=UPI0020C1628A|nr:nucleotidyltransferase family protein [Limibaculum sediminis]MCL5776875.1 nucleotidyltransferase family protein [Limibaculum sediminis]